MRSDCGPTLWATRSRRCFSSATRSLSLNVGAGGVIRMLDGMALSFLARTTTPTGLSMAKHASTTSSANVTRVVFFISFSWNLVNLENLVILSNIQRRAKTGLQDFQDDKIKNIYGVGVGAGVARRRGRGGLSTVRVPSFEIMNRPPFAVVMICVPSGRVRIVTP